MFIIGQITGDCENAGRRLSKDVIIQKPPSESYRLRITIEPKSKETKAPAAIERDQG